MYVQPSEAWQTSWPEYLISVIHSVEQNSDDSDDDDLSIDDLNAMWSAAERGQF
jgi:hypothetical protein